MTWLRVILISLQALSGLVAYLRERNLLAAGEAKAIADALELTNERVKQAQAARMRARDGDPDPHDPYLRD
jgi:cyanate lyase